MRVENLITFVVASPRTKANTFILLWIGVMTRLAVILSVVIGLLTGCRSPSGTGQARPVGLSGSPGRLASPPDASGFGSTVAYFLGQPIDWLELRPALVEAGGGSVLAELVLDRMVDQKLKERGQVVQSQHVDRERSLLTEALDPSDPDRAQQLLRQLRQRRGLGSHRFKQMLVRNAGLRLLIHDQVEVSRAAVEQAHQLEHGPRYEARLIVTDSLVQAADVVRDARAGKSFSDLAIAHSTDPSRAQGGLIGPVSPVDPTFPKAVRTTLASLEPGQASDPVALDDGFAVLRLERIVHGDDIEMERVKEVLQIRVRRQVERMLMRRLVRAMISEADVTILDPLLAASWRQHHRQILEDPQE